MPKRLVRIMHINAKKGIKENSDRTSAEFFFVRTNIIITGGMVIKAQEKNKSELVATASDEGRARKHFSVKVFAVDIIS